jgi:UV excision repair protein RAD23
MTNDQLEERINELIGITGAEREQAINALRAAFFDVNMAANYVFEGIPAHAQLGGGAPAPHGGAGIQPPQGFEGDEEGGEDINNPEAQQALAELQQLVANPAFQQLRAQARANPQIIPTIMEHLRQSSPNIHTLLQSNPELLAMLLLGEGAPGQPGAGGGAGGAGGRPRGNVVELTRDEMDAIERVGHV